MALNHALPKQPIHANSADPRQKLSSSPLTRLCWLVLACVALLGCSGASWQKVEIDSPYEVPKAMTIVVVARPMMKSASDALASALVSGLASHGVKAKLVSETSGTPDATVSIVKWDPGSRSLRWLAFAGKGEVIVTVQSMGVDGTAEGWVSGGGFGGSDEASAEAAGDLIAYTLATGLRDSSSKSKPESQAE